MNINKKNRISFRKYKNVLSLDSQDINSIEAKHLFFENLYNNPELRKLLQDVQNNKKTTNLNKIVSDSNFLLACLLKYKLYIFHKNKFMQDFKHNSQDIIFQEAISVLLNIVFESKKTVTQGLKFKSVNHINNVRTVLKSLKKKFRKVKWYLEGTFCIEHKYSKVTNFILLSKTLKTRIKDPIFLDILKKYLKKLFDKNKSITNRLFQIINNIHLYALDMWMKTFLKINLRNPIRKIITKVNSVKQKISNNNKENKITLKYNYIRYAAKFLIGVVGSKTDCLNIRKKIYNYLKKNLNVNLKNEQIIHAKTDYLNFLGFRISKKDTRKKKKKIKIDAPISEITKKLEFLGFLNKKTKKPTRNATLLNYNIKKIINIYKSVETEILTYYKIANNFKKLSLKLHWILKYSCAFTLAAKKKIKSIKKVFKKYGKILNRKKRLNRNNYSNKKKLNKTNPLTKRLI